MRMHLNRGLLVIIALLFLIACEVWEEEDSELVMTFMDEWMGVKQTDPTNDDGSLNPEAALNLGKRELTDSTGDDEADAALDAFEVLETINEADKLMEDGRSTGDPAKMDQAIAIRPQDWTYRTTRAALALEQGDMDAYQTHTTEAFRLTNGGQDNKLWVSNHTIREYEQTEKKLLAEGWRSSAQCITLYQELAAAYQARYELTQSPEDKQAQDRAFQNSDLCQQ